MRSFSMISFEPIGVIHTPYRNNAPYQPVSNDVGEFYIDLCEAYTDGLKELLRFKYIYLLFYIDRLHEKPKMRFTPPWLKNKELGLFATRTPNRPNPIGLSIVKLINVIDRKIIVSGLDVFDGTPLLDIKPYIKELDDKSDANYGWLDDVDNKEHFMLHIKGVPHDY